MRLLPSRLTDLVPHPRSHVGTCAVCGGDVFEDERHLRIHGVLLHRRCVAYRRMKDERRA